MVQTLLTALLSAAMVLTACGNSSTPSKKTTTTPGNGAETVMTVNGQDVTVDELRFYICMTAVNSGYSASADFDWQQAGNDGKPLADSIKEQAINDLTTCILVTQLAEKNGAGLNDDDKNQVNDMIEQYKASYGEESLELAVEALGVTSLDGYIKSYNLMVANSKAEQDMENNRDKYIKAEDTAKLQQYRSDEKVSAQHVLIKNDSEKHADPKTAIEGVLARAKAGEDFNALMDEFNEDPGESPSGYTFGKGVMVPEFESAAFALGYGEISDIVESSYGYHIIKRIVGSAELQGYMAATAKVEKNEAVLKEVTVEGVMTDAYNAEQAMYN